MHATCSNWYNQNATVCDWCGRIMNVNQSMILYMGFNLHTHCNRELMEAEDNGFQLELLVKG